MQKHLEVPWQQPFHPPSVAAFKRASILAGEEISSANLILDSGCGTGESTRVIASEHPESLVFGIDRSHHRLQRTGSGSFPCREANIIWVRAELETFWRLAIAKRWKPYRHYLLYPNPYPKRAHLKKRWHAHPVFPELLALGGGLELRCNWKIYAREFAHAIEFSLGIVVSVEDWQTDCPISAFERKYMASNHQLYRVRVTAEALSGARLLQHRNQ